MIGTGGQIIIGISVAGFTSVITALGVFFRSFTRTMTQLRDYVTADRALTPIITQRIELLEESMRSVTTNTAVIEKWITLHEQATRRHHD